MKNKKTYFLLILGLLALLNVQSQPVGLWGVTPQGGDNGLGVIYKLDGLGEDFTVEKSFLYENNGKFPGDVKFVETEDGKLYGLAVSGGLNDDGVIFEYDRLTGNYINKVHFDGEAKGKNPMGSLMMASNGKLYGMTNLGGVNNFGVLFEYDPSTESFVKKYDFDSEHGRGPSGSLVEGANGKLYGVTSLGGINNFGVLFEYDFVIDTLIKKVDFNGDINGRLPSKSLIYATNGKLYGMTSIGGSNNKGVLFEYNPATDTFVKKLDFDSGDNGNGPMGALFQAGSDKLYGMTRIGGVNDFGVLFEYDISTDTYTKKIDFDGENKGKNPTSSLMQTSNGKLYGMTSKGGVNDFGVLFEYDIASGIFSKKQDYNDLDNGKSPGGSLMEASNNKLYGVTAFGGSGGSGTVFEYDFTADNYVKLLDLNINTEGERPAGSLLLASNGLLYGMTTNGGEGDFGVLFEYNPETGDYSTKVLFDNVNKGKWPWVAALMQADNGKLYGVTNSGGTNNRGVLFEYDPVTEIYTKKVDFNEIDHGKTPTGALIQSSNGKLYGTNRDGGANGFGVLYEYDIANNTFAKKLDFAGTGDGRYPKGSLLELIVGKLYGAAGGGANEDGVLFEYDIATDTYSKLTDFEESATGRTPNGSLVLASNGKLYGLTNQGGTSGDGVLFEFDLLNDTIVKKIDFSFSNGKSPEGSLMQSNNGKLYGTTNEGGVFSFGTVFEYDFNANVLTLKHSFDQIHGRFPNGHLVEIVDGCTNSSSGFSEIACGSYTVPSGNATYTESGIYVDTLVNACGADSLLIIDLTIISIDLTLTTNDATVMANDSDASYQWLDCNNNFAIIPGETDQSFTATQNGNYAVELTKNNCVDTSECVAITIVGIEEKALLKEVNIYPNPTRGVVNIDLGKLNNVSVMVYTIDGKLIYQKENINDAIFYFELNDVPGVYFLELTYKEEKQRYKIVKK